MQISKEYKEDPAGPSLRWLEQMLLIRTYEMHLASLQSKGVPGTCTSVGQEACAVGVVAALEKRDRILTNHRSAAHLLARGAEPGRMLAEVLGRVDGYCGGFSGSLHISAKELGIILTSTIVGGELSLAPGVALAQKMGQGESGGIVTVFFGDGAACEGIFHEALNLAVQWHLPLLFVCENNQWQAFVHRLETMPDKAISNWARGHDLEVETVDGNDVHAVFEATSRAVSAIRGNSKPRFLELCTYRQRGHFEPDDQAYVDKQELSHWLERDPINRLSQRLLQQGRLTQQRLDEMQQAMAKQILTAQAFADASPCPEEAMLTRHVYA